MQTEQRKLATIMFTDIVGYSAMMSKNEKQATTQKIIRMTEKDLVFAHLKYT